MFFRWKRGKDSPSEFLQCGRIVKEDTKRKNDSKYHDYRIICRAAIPELYKLFHNFRRF